MINIKDVCEIFSEELKERMEEADLSSHQLVCLCKLDPAKIQLYLDGKKLPNLFSLVLLAEHLNCAVNELLGFNELEDEYAYERFLASEMYFMESQYAQCLADRVRHCLHTRNMTFAELAKRSGLNSDSIRRWFSPTKPHLPTTAKFLQICDALQCTPSELLGY